MLKVNLNYPTSKATAHADPACIYFREAGSRGERTLLVRASTFSEALAMVSDRGAYPFAAQAGLNGLWLLFDFDDAALELAAADYFRRVIGRSTRRIGRAELKIHCQPPGQGR